ncbi:MAG TPA: ABC transporter permease [Phototrophicaceae bacterium]|nr:ABC transporter permease [Phototrophicaceae bacterium]
MALEKRVESPQKSGEIAQSLGMRQAILLLSRVWAWLFLLALILVFTITTKIYQQVDFLTVRNSQNILVEIVPVLLMGLGQTFVIIAGGIDLSVGWVMGMASVVSASVIVILLPTGIGEGLSILLGFGAGLVSAMIPGFVNGLIIAKLRIPSFIVTLGMSFIARGIAYLISGGNVVIGMPPGVRNFGNESMIYLLNGNIYFFQHPDATGIALRSLDRVFTYPVVVAALVVGVAVFVLRRTRFGRHTYAIGGNAEAASRAGIRVDRHMIILYTLSGLTVGLAGILHTARFNGGSPIAGDPLLLSSIAAVIIGGVSMFGGHGNIVGTVIGALIIALLTTGLVMLNVQPFWQYVVVGVVVILAVLIDQGRDLIIGRMKSE